MRDLRQQRRWTQADLAHHSGLSVRFVSQLESGDGNISLSRLDDVASALQTSPGALVAEQVELQALPLLDDVAELLHHHPADEVKKALGLARSLLLSPAGQRVALLGIRGAGKTTIGSRVARRLRVPFLELDTLIEKMAGLTLGAIFELHGEAYYRRLERQALTELLQRPSFVVATGGSLVTSPEHYALLQRLCTTVWLRATPEDLWRRVIEQGDARPMRQNPRAMDELRALFEARRPLYEQAALTIDTHDRSADEVADALLAALPQREA